VLLLAAQHCDHMLFALCKQCQARVAQSYSRLGARCATDDERHGSPVMGLSSHTKYLVDGLHFTIKCMLCWWWVWLTPRASPGLAPAPPATPRRLELGPVIHMGKASWTRCGYALSTGEVAARLHRRVGGLVVGGCGSRYVYTAEINLGVAWEASDLIQTLLLTWCVHEEVRMVAGEHRCLSELDSLM
jgi:hypothetical protein